MSSRRERRRSESQHPLMNETEYADSENLVGRKGKKKTRRGAKVQTKLRAPLGVLPQNSVDIKGKPMSLGKPSLPEIPVKFNKEGHLEVNNRVSVAVQSEPTGCVDKGVQTDTPTEESVHYRMCTEETPPIEYWQVLAEQRREALVETLKENEQLYAEIEQLKAKLSDQKKQQQQSDYFSFMYKLSTDQEENK